MKWCIQGQTKLIHRFARTTSQTTARSSVFSSTCLSVYSDTITMCAMTISFASFNAFQSGRERGGCGWKRGGVRAPKLPKLSNT